ARYASAEVLRGVRIGTPMLKRGVPLILDATMEDDTLAIHLDGLKRVEGASGLGNFYYIPILVIEGEQLRRDHRLLLGLLALVIGDLQAKPPTHGIVIRGKGMRAGKVQLSTGSRAARRALADVGKLTAADSSPKLILNDHCPVCEFRDRCHLQAV